MQNHVTIYDKIIFYTPVNEVEGGMLVFLSLIFYFCKYSSVLFMYPSLIINWLLVLFVSYSPFKILMQPICTLCA